MAESIYGSHFPEMERVMNSILSDIGALRADLKMKYGHDPVEHCLGRIKEEDSMREKCRRKGFPETTQSALEDIHDAIGIRIVCAFISDVYKMRDFLVSREDAEVFEEKDYIKHAKPNGYRSYHLILKFHGLYFVELQIRTISQDTWAALEHQMKYKKGPHLNEDLIVSELKRCADELASTDISMQTIRDMIFEEGDMKTEANASPLLRG